MSPVGGRLTAPGRLVGAGAGHEAQAAHAQQIGQPEAGVHGQRLVRGQRPRRLPHEAALQVGLTLTLRAPQREAGQAQAKATAAPNLCARAEDDRRERLARLADVVLAAQRPATKAAQLRAKEGSQVAGDRAGALISAGDEPALLGHDALPLGEHDALPLGEHDALPLGEHDALPLGEHDALPLGEHDALPLGEHDALPPGEHDALPPGEQVRGVPAPVAEGGGGAAHGPVGQAQVGQGREDGSVCREEPPGQQGQQQVAQAQVGPHGDAGEHLRQQRLDAVN